jgi:peroxiredoxin
MPGTFVVARDGRLAYAHYNKDQSDNPPMEEVLEAVRSAA